MSRWSGLVIGVALVVATLAAYGSVLQNGFVDLDDRDYVLANPYVRQGLSWQTIVWSFTSFDMSNWHPLTWLSWALDARLYGLSPAGFMPPTCSGTSSACCCCFGCFARRLAVPHEAPLSPPCLLCTPCTSNRSLGSASARTCSAPPLVFWRCGRTRDTPPGRRWVEGYRSRAVWPSAYWQNRCS